MSHYSTQIDLHSAAPAADTTPVQQIETNFFPSKRSWLSEVRRNLARPISANDPLAEGPIPPHALTAPYTANDYDFDRLAFVTVDVVASNPVAEDLDRQNSELALLVENWQDYCRHFQDLAAIQFRIGLDYPRSQEAHWLSNWRTLDATERLAPGTLMQNFWRSQRRAKKETNRAEYYMIMEDVLGSRGYKIQDSYEDVLGGTVYEFMREDERVTGIITDDGVQVLFVSEQEVVSRVIANSASSKVELTQFIDTNIM